MPETGLTAGRGRDDVEMMRDAARGPGGERLRRGRAPTEVALAGDGARRRQCDAAAAAGGSIRRRRQAGGVVVTTTTELQRRGR